MKKNTWKRNALLASLLVAAAAGGCAQDIGDIDRTEPNKIKKSDLTSGTWYMVQKIAHEDSITERYAGNEGSTATTQKVMFVVEENYLIAYRAYVTLPGSDDVTLNMYGPDSYEELYDSDYKQGIEAIYPITSHFDVQRQYDTATGEQSNVIVENTTDRNWWERDYMRVDWGGNPIVNIDMMMEVYDDLTTMTQYNHPYDLNADGSDPNAPYFERDKDGKLIYFDTPITYVYEPWWHNCLYGEWRYTSHYKFGTCASTEIRIVTGFLRDNGDRNFEPVKYTMQDMNRFGYFLTERRVYDPYYEFMNDAVTYLANIHNIWETAYNDDGSIKPISERTVKTKPYYVRNLPNEEYLEKAAHDSIEIWNKTFKKAVRVIQGKVDKPTELTDELIANDKDVYVMCHIPVDSSKGDRNEICGPDGYAPREADPRYDTIWVVNQRQDNGLLGYCPSFDDPVTGEALAAVAHVYTEGMNQYAARIIDMVKYLNGDMTDDEVLSNAYRIEGSKARAKQFVDIQYASQIAKTKDIEKVEKARSRSLDRKTKREMFLQKPDKYNYDKTDSIIKKAYKDGMLTEVGTEDINNYFSKVFNMDDPSQVSEQVKEEASIYGITSPALRKLQRQNQLKMSKLGYCFDNSYEDAKMAEYAVIAREFIGRHDYDNIARELRGRVFVGTTVHEMGHGFGLRHNTAGSADALNYRDRFWELRADENFNKDIKSPSDLAKLYDYTDKQLGAIPKTGDPTEDAIGDAEAKKGSMMMQMSTSIMDYTSYFDDWNGVGRYDLAAIIYAYSKGTDIVKGESSALCKAKGGEVVGNDCKRVVSGIIEVFDDDHRLKDLGVFGQILSHKDTTGAISAKITYDADGSGKLVEKTLYSTFDDPTTVGQPYGELVHYHDMARLFPNNNLGNGTPTFITARKYARTEDYLVSRAKDGDNAMVRVPYYFCTDDNAGQLATCNYFDYGADMYEQVRQTINDYKDYYWFSNYARGRSFWDAFRHSLGWYSSFVELTDRFQNAYMQSDVLDDIIEENGLDLMQHVQDAANVASLNFLAQVVATPEYGVFCKRKDDNSLFPLSPDAEASAETSEFYRRAICGKDPEYYYVKPGEGRRRYQKYDVNYGHDYAYIDYESMHMYTSSFAAMALLDNEADVIADSGDIGAYNFGMYNVYDVEITNLYNAMLADDYKGISPVLDLSDNEVITVNGEEIRTGTLRYKPLAYVTWWNSDGSYYSYDPLSWQSEDDAEDYFAADHLTVEADTSHTQKYFMGAYGMIFTAESWKSNFYDQLNIWRAGSGEAITAGTGYDTISFTSPYDSGDVYSANYIDCSKADLAHLPGVCIANGLDYVGATGGALLLDHANKQAEKMSNAYSDYVTKYRNLTPSQRANSDSEEYQDMLNSYYEYRMYEYQTEYALRDINMIRGFYQYFGSLF